MYSLCDAIKRMSVEAVKAGAPADITSGEVKSISPLIITVGTLDLAENFFMIPQRLTDYQVNIEAPEWSGTITVKNSLNIGDKVILAKADGGQKYAVIDRM